MKWISIVMAVAGGGLTAYGFSGFDAGVSKIFDTLRGSAGWDNASRIEMVIGVALLILGTFSYEESRKGS